MKRTADRISTGCPGLDEVLAGGLTPNRLYLLEGVPGAGKTTLALQFLTAAVAAGEGALYVTLSETTDELNAVASSHGWDLSAIEIVDLASIDEVLGMSREQTILHPWEVELGEIVGMITQQVERVTPRRVVFDSLSELRLLAQDPLRYRRQILALKRYFSGKAITVMLVDDLTARGAANGETQLHSLCHGVISLSRQTLEYGMARRRLEVQKMRGVQFRAGYHDLEIRRGGLEVFPRLVAAEHDATFSDELVKSGVPALDSLMNGGLLRGSTSLITGPAGCGKTTLAMQYVMAACARGERCAVYQFDERVGTLLIRTASMGLDLVTEIEAGRLTVDQIDPAEVSPGEFASRVRAQVERRGVRCLIIDSLSGYLAAMPAERDLMLHIHELVSYLNHKAVVTILVNAQHGLVGSMSSSNGIEVSYVADAVLLLRYFEAGGRVRKAISVLKNRSGGHEDFIREFRVDSTGVRIGEPLTEFRGVLTGTPEYTGPVQPLLEAFGDDG